MSHAACGNAVREVSMPGPSSTDPLKLDSWYRPLKQVLPNRFAGVSFRLAGNGKGF
jgi:hypothetical protein